jgi:lipopolysaccharide-induced tumor necrosis factor-alpha factor
MVSTGSHPTAIPLLRADSAVVHCPECGSTGYTVLEYKAGLLTYLVCAGLAVGGCFCGCCLIPCCMDIMRDVRHKCAGCGQLLVTYERL